MTDYADELAQHSTNFGYLVAHEPLLAIDGAVAESYIYNDPDSALAKARRFTETLSKRIEALATGSVTRRHLSDRINALSNAGHIPPSIATQFHEVRAAGNQAVHTPYGDIWTAMVAVGCCFELGAWHYRTLTGDSQTRAFVPPSKPTTLPPVTEIDLINASRLTNLLAEYERRLVRAETRRPSHTEARDEAARLGTPVGSHAGSPISPPTYVNSSATFGGLSIAVGRDMNNATITPSPDPRPMEA